MQGCVQVQDTTRNAFALANELFYEDSLKQVTLQREAAVALRTEDKVRFNCERRDRHCRHCNGKDES